MGKQITIIFVVLFNCTVASSQDYWMKTTTPCDKALLLKTPGEWMKPGHGYHATVSKPQLQEIEDRLKTIHQFVHNIYPSPMAFDAVWGFFTDDVNFASQIKIETTQDRYRNSFINGIPTILYSYGVKFCDYNCGRTTYEIMRGRGCEAGTSVSVVMNSLESFFSRLLIDDDYMDIMRIDGRPMRMMPVLKGKWKGYDLYSPESGSGLNMVLLHRDGILPYIPVTRKQYLDRSIEWLQQFFDKGLKSVENPEGLAVLMDKKEKDEQVKKYRKLRDDVLKYYRDELDATTKAGLLDSHAIIFGGTMANILTQYPIFITQADGGRLLVTENPAYIKKEIAKYIPQMIIYTMWNSNDGPDPALNPYHLYYRDFPIEKLQAMIDK
jgi:hypothetical protein